MKKLLPILLLALATTLGCQREPSSEPTKRQKLEEFGCRAGVDRFCVPEQCRADADTPDFANCADYLALDVDDCDRCRYYACREAARTDSCGPGGYYLGYALKYCQRLSGRVAAKMSPQGKRWLDEVRRCLPEHMEEHVSDEATCRDVSDHGISSHRDCFLEAGVCDLPMGDWFSFSIAMDLWDAELYEVPLDTTWGCFQHWLGL